MSNSYKDNEIDQYIRTIPLNDLQRKADKFIDAQRLTDIDVITEKMASMNNDKNIKGDAIKFHDYWSNDTKGKEVWKANARSTSQEVTVNGRLVPVNDMDFYLAESLQMLQAGQSPEAEYYDWVNQAKIILKDMQVDGTSKEELHTRDVFVGFLNERETELKRVISLYAGAAFNSADCPQKSIAQEKLIFLTFKLSELRRIRERVENAQKTRSPLKQNLAYTQNLPPELREKVLRSGSEIYNVNLDDEEELDASASQVSIAFHVCAVNAMRIMHDQNSNNNSSNQQSQQLTNEDLPKIEIEKRKSLGRWMQRLRGRLDEPQPNLTNTPQPNIRGFSSEKYERILAMRQKETEYSAVY